MRGGRLARVAAHGTGSAIRVAIIGAGQMGGAMAAQAVRTGADVTLWDRDASAIDAIARGDCPPRLPGLRLPAGVRACHRVEDALEGASVVVSAVPTQSLRVAWSALSSHVPPGAALISTAKGFELGTLLRPTEVLHEMLGRRGAHFPIVAMSGPAIAPEIVRGLPTAMVAASPDAAAAARACAALASETLRLYPSDDVVGVETAGAAKNVIALAAGMLDGMGLGTNAKATLLARGIAEIARLGLVLGGRADTFWGVAGIGDLATTCFSPDGRNRAFGERLGSGMSVDQARAASGATVEGVDTCTALAALRQRHDVEMPICMAVHAVLAGAQSPRDALAGLMRRSARPEQLAS
jgi:glycerol-3-phosphate dehydrogenase (NAD(P)+)